VHAIDRHREYIESEILADRVSLGDISHALIRRDLIIGTFPLTVSLSRA
jgi:hypothetical protein